MGSFKVKKVLNNNVLIAGHDTFQEVVLIGKGIGFEKKRGELISNETVEKIFVLKNEQEQEQYKKLLPYTNEKMIEVVSDCIAHISKKVGLPLNEHIHIALTDHITFAIKRIEQGMDIKNPFLSETEVLYPKEYNIASEVVSIIEDKLKIKLPKGEIGFIALHIHSAITHKSISEVNRHSQLIAQLIEVAEDSLNIQLDKESFNYLRLVRHLQATIERVLKEEKTEEPEELALLLKKKCPLCYNVAWKMIKMMQQVLKKQIDEAEAVYLTMHLYRIAKKE
ncbi:PRD domain-containing protein [Aeribacillus sp. FSL K6-8210]|uniref:glucose PTS transporter transcription antiterminator GlcT n=1 Tax=Aeribacillus sp. FSL K6-8210 TaxID=2954683 RepID=UPI0030CE1611